MKFRLVIAGLIAGVCLAVTPGSVAQAATPVEAGSISSFPEVRWGWYTGSNLVRVWQTYLAVRLGASCSTIDGQFGPNTFERTKTWQRWSGIGVDGQVGPQTWGTADALTSFLNPGEYPERFRYEVGSRFIELRWHFSGEELARVWSFHSHCSGQLDVTY